MTGSDGLAEDLTQEVFLRAVRSLPEDPELQERAWLFRTARNLLMNRRRDDGRRPSTVPLEDVPLGSAVRAHSAARPSGQQGEVDTVDLERALAALDEADRDVFLMRELGGLGYE